MNIKQKTVSLLLLSVMVLSVVFTVPASAAENNFKLRYSVEQGDLINISFGNEFQPVQSVEGTNRVLTIASEEVVTMIVKAKTNYTLTKVIIGGVNQNIFNNQVTYQFDGQTSDMSMVVQAEKQQPIPITVSGSNFDYTLTGASNNAAPLGTTVSIKITPNAGYVINTVTLNGTSKGSVDEFSFTVAQTNNIVVTMTRVAPEEYSLGILNASGGSILSPDGLSFTAGSTVRLNISPDPGYSLKSLKINGTNVTEFVTDNKYTFTINKNTTVESEFVRNYILNYNIGTGGTVTVDGKTVSGVGNLNIENGKEIFLIITPSDTYKINSVRLGSAEFDPSTSFIMNESKQLQVTFEATEKPKPTYRITTNTGAGGRITPPSKDVEEGEDFIFTVIPDVGYVIDAVKVDGKEVELENNTYTIEDIRKSIMIYASFKAETVVSGYVEVEDVNWSGNTVIINLKSNTKVAKAVFAKINNDCKNKTVIFEGANYKITLKMGAVLSVSEDFADLNITINGGSYYSNAHAYVEENYNGAPFTLLYIPGGSILPAGTVVSVNIGLSQAEKEVQYLIFNNDNRTAVNPAGETATSKIGSDGWFGVSYYGDSIIILVTSNQGDFTINATCSSGGSINPAGIKQVLTNDIVLYSVTADTGYVIKTVMVDGNEIKKAAGEESFEYKFDGVKESHMISVEFILKEEYKKEKSNAGLIVIIILIIIALGGAGTLFFVKWKQEKY